MNLFDIFSNPIIFLVAIYFVIKSFKNRSVNSEENKGQPSAKLDPMHPKHFEQRKRTNNEYEMTPKTNNVDKQVIIPNEEHYVLYETNYDFVARDSLPISPTNTESNKRKQIKKVITRDKPLKKSNIIEGVIWAEVLGPPRASKKWSPK